MTDEWVAFVRRNPDYQGEPIIEPTDEWADLRRRDEQDWAVLASAFVDPVMESPPHTLAMVDRHRLLAERDRLAQDNAALRAARLNVTALGEAMTVLGEPYLSDRLLAYQDADRIADEYAALLAQSDEAGR